MKLVKINTLLVKAAKRHHDTPQQAFNTSFHPAASAPDLPRPDEAPYSFKRWLPLILQTRQHPIPVPAPKTPYPFHHWLPQLTRQPPTTTTPFTNHASPPITTTTTTTPTPTLTTVPPLQTITLTPPQTRLLLAATNASIPRGEPNRLFREDLAETILPALRAQLVFPPEGLFMRLAACSPKDGGTGPLHSAEEVVGRLVVSVRARNAVVGCLDAVERGGGDGDGEGGVELFFLRFDGRMASEREYRVFCCPGEGRVVGVSQYRWYMPWRFQRVDVEEKERLVRGLVRAAKEVTGMILGVVESRGDRLDRLMMEQGFSFDLLYDEESESCELVELNTFGVRSGCGSCLFQWVEDRGVLYGEEEPEFRVSVDMVGRGVPGPELVRVSRLREEGESGALESTKFCGGDWRASVREFDWKFP